MDPFNIVVAILCLALIGFLVYLIITYIPMPEPFKQVIVVACVVLVVLYLLGIVSGHLVPVNLGYRR